MPLTFEFSSSRVYLSPESPHNYPPTGEPVQQKLAEHERRDGEFS